MISDKYYPKQISPRRYARPGFIPEAAFARRIAMGQNHVQSYRRKEFLVFSDYTNLVSASVTTVPAFRTYIRTGHGATHVVARLGMAYFNNLVGTVDDPHVEMTLTIPAGASVSGTAHQGANESGVITDTPNTIVERVIRVPVDANEVYEVLLEEHEGARIADLVIYEEASPTVDLATDYFAEQNYSTMFPIYDSDLQRRLQGLSELWEKNASVLMCWPGDVDRVQPTFTATWTNVLNGATSVSAATPGFYIGSDGDIPGEPLCRLSDSSAWSASGVFAAYGSVAAGSDGEVRLQNAGGTVCTVGSITTTPGWFTANVTISGFDTLEKVDLQARSAGSTLTLHAATLFLYQA